jgi:hypothetical protein
MPPLRIKLPSAVDIAKQLPEGKGWRLLAPGKKRGRRAILIKKLEIAGRTLAIFHVLPGTR